MNLEAARQQMVEQQVRAWEVLDPRVLEVLASVPREHFVPEKYQGLAFADTEIPIAHDQVMMAPKVEGRLLQALDLKGEENVLEIGTGSGFLCACLARLARQVTSLEIYDELSTSADDKLQALALRNFKLEVADATRLETSKSYDAIAVTASAPRRMRRFEKALNKGGRLFMIVGDAPVMEAMLITRVGDNTWTSQSLFETCIAPLVNVEQPSRFRF